MKVSRRVGRLVFRTVGVVAAGIIAGFVVAPSAWAATSVSGALLKQWSLPFSGDTVDGITVSLDGNTAYADATGTIGDTDHEVLLKISLTTGAIIKTLDLGPNPGSFTAPVLSPDGSTVYATTALGGTGGDSSTLFAVNADSLMTNTSREFVGSALAGLAVNSSGVYVEVDPTDTDSSSDAKLLSLDPASLSQTASVTLGSNAGVLTAAGTTVFVGGAYSGNLEVFDASTGAITSANKTISGLGSSITSLAATPDAAKVFASVDGSIKAVNVSTGKILSSVSVQSPDAYLG